MLKLRKVFIFLMIMVILTLQCGVVSAIPPLDTAVPCTLTIQYVNGGTAVDGTDFRVYRIAERIGYSGLVFCPPFDSSQFDLSDIDQDAWNAMALTLVGLVNQYGLTPDYSGTTDAKGILEFTDMPCGLYLLVGDSRTIGKDTFTCSPGVILLPGTDAQQENWQYHVTVNPKNTRTTTPTEDKTVTRKVLKVWKDDGYQANRPASVVVYLYRNGKLYDSVTLNSANNWRYSWSKLSAKYTWSVSEKTVANYTSVVTRSGVTFVVTNTYTPPYTPPNNTPPNNTTQTNTTTTFQLPHTDMPQTGQLWWPVMLLTVLGLLFFSIGLIIRREERE